MGTYLLSKEYKDTGISKTGYRALFLFRLLLEAPRTRDEIIAEFAKDPIIGKDFSKDTITNTANALREAGCLIVRPNMRTDFRYVLINHPFAMKIPKKFVPCLLDIRKGLVTFKDWKKIEGVNRLYDKLVPFIEDKESSEQLIAKTPLKCADKKVLKDLARFCFSKKAVNIKYLSAKNGIEDIGFIPEYLQYENDKLYVWGYSYKYENIGYLRVDKIKSVDVIDFSDKSSVIEKYRSRLPKAKFVLSGYSAHMYEPENNERIIRKTKTEIYVEADVCSEFNFIQRLLYFGADCVLKSPKDLSEKYVEIIKKMRAAYDDK